MLQCGMSRDPGVGYYYSLLLGTSRLCPGTLGFGGSTWKVM